MKVFDRILNKIDEVLFPGFKCFVCGKETFGGESKLCVRCEKKFPLISGNICEKCGMPLPEGNIICDTCKERKFVFDSARASFVYDEMTHGMLYKLKYGGNQYIADFFGELIFETYKKWGIVADIVLPVPLFSKRERKRGYNQSMLIARKFSELSGIPLDDEIIFRTVETPNQTRLSRSQREINLLGAFSYNSNKKISGKNVLLIDDMFTTGSTSNEIARVLRRHKPSAIYVLSAGKTQYFL